jgi:dihydrofolate reductase
MIVAVADNGVIGKAGKIPWRVPDDWAYFKKTTLGHPIIMGKGTYESLGKPLPGRKNIVISSTKSYQAAGCAVVGSLPAALAAARGAEGDNEIFIIGGASIYELALPVADRLYLTRVHANPEGDRFFPKYDASNWREISAEPHRADDRNEYDYDFVILERRAG